VSVIPTTGLPWAKKKKKSKTLSGNLEKRSKTVMGRGLNGKTLSSNPSRGKKMFQV
jgi:hypothetical protein